MRRTQDTKRGWCGVRFSRGHEPVDAQRDTCEGRLVIVTAPTATQAEKSHRLLSESWRPREAGGEFSPMQRPENRGANGVSPSLRPMAGERGALMSQGRRWMSRLNKRENSPSSAFLRYLGNDAHPRSLFSPPIPVLTSPTNTPTDAPEVMFDPRCGHPSAHSGWHHHGGGASTAQTPSKDIGLGQPSV